MSHLIGAVLIVRAVILVDNDRIFDISHEHMFEDNSFDEASTRPGPRLDPQPILRTCKHCSLDGHVYHACLVLALTQASNAANHMHRLVSTIPI